MTFPKTAPVRLYGKDKQALRAACMERDQWTCQRCGAKVSDHYPDWYALKAQMAHKKGLGANGSDTLENVECACLNCHMIGEHAGGQPCPAK